MLFGVTESRTRYGEWKERDVTRALDGLCDVALMERAVSADAAWNDFAALGDEVLERLRIFVIDGDHLLRAELANALFSAAPSAWRIGVEIGCTSKIILVIHH